LNIMQASIACNGAAADGVAWSMTNQPCAVQQQTQLHMKFWRSVQTKRIIGRPTITNCMEPGDAHHNLHCNPGQYAGPVLAPGPLQHCSGLGLQLQHTPAKGMGQEQHEQLQTAANQLGAASGLSVTELLWC